MRQSLIKHEGRNKKYKKEGKRRERPSQKKVVNGNGKSNQVLGRNKERKEGRKKERKEETKERKLVIGF